MVPFYERDGITIYCGDCLKIMPGLESVDVVASDIPYGEINHIDRLHKRAKYKGGQIRKLHKGDADTVTYDLDNLLSIIDSKVKSWIYIFAGDKTGYIRAFFNQRDCMTRIGVWEKTNPTPLHCQYIWLSSVELCAIIRKRKAEFNYYYKSPVWHFPTSNKTKHPTEKPADLFRELVASSTKSGGVVLDPFMGSGTTLVAAQQEGRRAIGIEISEEYCKIAVERLRQPSFFSLPQMNNNGLRAKQLELVKAA